MILHLTFIQILPDRTPLLQSGEAPFEVLPTDGGAHRAGYYYSGGVCAHGACDYDVCDYYAYVYYVCPPRYYDAGVRGDPCGGDPDDDALHGNVYYDCSFGDVSYVCSAHCGDGGAREDPCEGHLKDDDALAGACCAYARDAYVLYVAAPHCGVGVRQDLCGEYSGGDSLHVDCACCDAYAPSVCAPGSFCGGLHGDLCGGYPNDDTLPHDVYAGAGADVHVLCVFCACVPAGDLCGGCLGGPGDGLQWDDDPCAHHDAHAACVPSPCGGAWQIAPCQDGQGAGAF